MSKGLGACCFPPPSVWGDLRDQPGSGRPQDEWAGRRPQGLRQGGFCGQWGGGGGSRSVPHSEPGCRGTGPWETQGCPNLSSPGQAPSPGHSPRPWRTPRSPLPPGPRGSWAVCKLCREEGRVLPPPRVGAQDGVPGWGGGHLPVILRVLGPGRLQLVTHPGTGGACPKLGCLPAISLLAPSHRPRPRLRAPKGLPGSSGTGPGSPDLGVTFLALPWQHRPQHGPLCPLLRPLGSEWAQQGDTHGEGCRGPPASPAPPTCGTPQRDRPEVRAARPLPHPLPCPPPPPPAPRHLGPPQRSAVTAANQRESAYLPGKER